MSQTLTILRYESSQQGTFGVCLHDGRWLCHCIEPACRDGQRDHAVAAGVYELRCEWSPRFGRCLPTIIVPGRSGLRFHAGNFVSDTRGCVLPGKQRARGALYESAAALEELITYITINHLNQLHIIDYESLFK